MKRRPLAFLAMAMPLTVWAEVQEVPARRPNVVVILADDLGWGDLGCYPKGAAWGEDAKVATPHLDRLAAGGVRCTQAYAAAMVSAPSRASLLSGRYSQRFGWYGFEECNVGIPQNIPRTQRIFL